MRLLPVAVLGSTLCFNLGCAHPESSSRSSDGAAAKVSANASLYERLGKKPALEAVVTDFLGNVAADRRINARFVLSDVADLKAKLVEQICAATGGPCTYSGRGMKEVHAHMGITGADFQALVEDLTKSLDTFKVPAREKNELLTALASMRGDIVESP